MPATNAEAHAMLDALLELESGLTDWEVEFTDSVDKQRRAWAQTHGGRQTAFVFSPKQAVTVEKIHKQRIDGEDTR